MPSMTTYLSKGFFLLPLSFIRRDFSQNFNWLTVNFPICSALTLAPGKSSGESSTCSCRLLAHSPCCFEFTARAIKPRLHATSGFFWNRCIWIFCTRGLAIEILDICSFQYMFIRFVSFRFPKYSEQNTVSRSKRLGKKKLRFVKTVISLGNEHIYGQNSCQVTRSGTG